MMLESIIERQAADAFGWVLLAGGLFVGYVLGLIVSWFAWKGGRR